MKSLLIAATLLLGVSVVNADLTQVNRSSAIAAVNYSTYVAAGFLDSVVIGMATSGGVLEIYNSTFTTSVLISSISLATVGDRQFNNLAVKGLFYRVSTNTNGVTIIYKR